MDMMLVGSFYFLGFFVFVVVVAVIIVEIDIIKNTIKIDLIEYGIEGEVLANLKNKKVTVKVGDFVREYKNRRQFKFFVDDVVFEVDLTNREQIVACCSHNNNNERG